MAQSIMARSMPAVVSPGSFWLTPCSKVIGGFGVAGARLQDREISGGDRIRRVRSQRRLVLTHSHGTVTREVRQKAESPMQVWIRLVAFMALSLLQQRHRPMPCFLIAKVGHLEISQPEVAVACVFRHPPGSGLRALRLRGRRRRTALDAMVGHLFVGHVSGFFAGHVTSATVWLIGVVLGDKDWAPWQVRHRLLK